MVYESLFGGMVAAAKTKGWTLAPDSTLLATMTYAPVTLSGTEDGVRVELLRYSAVHTFATMAFIEPACATELVITSEGVTGAIASKLGIKDVEIGDPDFDRTFRLVAKDEEALKRIVTPEVKAALQELAAAASHFGSHFAVTDKAVSLQHAHLGFMTEEETLRDVPLVVRVARAFAKR